MKFYNLGHKTFETDFSFKSLMNLNENVKTLNGMGEGGGIHTPLSWRFYLHCAKTFGTRELKPF